MPILLARRCICTEEIAFLVATLIRTFQEKDVFIQKRECWGESKFKHTHEVVRLSTAHTKNLVLRLFPFHDSFPDR